MSTKEKIMEVAATLFFNNGYEGVSVRDITQQAGANVASVNYHFNSKKELYRDVFRSRLRTETTQMIGKIRRPVIRISRRSPKMVRHPRCPK